MFTFRDTIIDNCLGGLEHEREQGLFLISDCVKCKTERDQNGQPAYMESEHKILSSE